MKKITALICVFVLTLWAAFSLCACGEEEDSIDTESTASQTTAQSKSEQSGIMGTWQIVKDDGTKDTLFYYIFGEDKAQMVMDNVAYYSDYTYENGKLTVQLFYNLNGTYKCEFSKDESRVTLTDTSDSGTKFSMERAGDYDPTPVPPENPVIDKKLLGKWKEDGGMSYEFREDGIMINDSFGVMSIYAQYSAKDGTISLKYKQGTEVEDEYSYSFDGDVLTVDGVELVKE